MLQTELEQLYDKLYNGTEAGLKNYRKAISELGGYLLYAETNKELLESIRRYCRDEGVVMAPDNLDNIHIENELRNAVSLEHAFEILEDVCAELDIVISDDPYCEHCDGIGVILSSRNDVPENLKKNKC
jgi:predicted methyltransferase